MGSWLLAWAVQEGKSCCPKLEEQARARLMGMAGALFAADRADGVRREGREGISIKTTEGEMQGMRFWG